MAASRARKQGRLPEKDVASSSFKKEPEYLVVGRIVAPRGVRGELKVAPETTDPEHIRLLVHVYLGEEHIPFNITQVRLHAGSILLRLEGIDSREDAEPWRNAIVSEAHADASPLEEDEYYYHQLVGLKVMTTEGEALGELKEVLQTGANDVYVVQGPGGEVLLPALKDVVVNVDLRAGTMLVKIPEGLR